MNGDRLTTTSPAKLRALRDRAISAEDRREWTRAAAAETESDKKLLASLLVFRVGPEWLGLPTSAFHEVAPVSAVHSVPHRIQGTLLGVANVRGELLTCVSINSLLNLPESPSGDASSGRFLVIEQRGHRFVIRVDEVDAVRQYDPDSLVTLPATVEISVPHFTSGMLRIGARAIGVLDSALLMGAVSRAFA